MKMVFSGIVAFFMRGRSRGIPLIPNSFAHAAWFQDPCSNDGYHEIFPRRAKKKRREIRNEGRIPEPCKNIQIVSVSNCRRKLQHITEQRDDDLGYPSILFLSFTFFDAAIASQDQLQKKTCSRQTSILTARCAGYRNVDLGGGCVLVLLEHLGLRLLSVAAETVSPSYE